MRRTALKVVWKKKLFLDGDRPRDGDRPTKPPDLEIVRSVSGNLNVFTEKFLQNERLYPVKKYVILCKNFLMMGH